MDASIHFIKTAALVIIGLLVVFVGAGAVAVVLGGTTWETLGDWTLKAVSVAGILFLINVVGSVIAGLLRKK